jgi:hypothetical protein
MNIILKNESSRAKNESSRAKNESSRAKNESSRAKNESSHVKAAIFTILFTFSTTFSIESFAQCTKPEGQIAASPVFVYDASADSMIITVPVKNTGTAAFASPFKITVYKNDVGDAKRYTYNYNGVIAAGETVDVTFGVEDFKAEWTSFDTIKIRINDGGNGYNNQPVCDSARRDHKSVQLIASDDYVLIFNNSTDNQFRVAINDILPTSYVNITVNLLASPAYAGTATVGGQTIFYTPAAGATADTVRYRIHCGNAEYADTATIYIKVMEKTENIGDAECFVEPQGTAWSIKETTMNTNAVVHNYGPLTVGDIDGDNTVEILGFLEDSRSSNWYESAGMKIFYFNKSTQQVVLEKQFNFEKSVATFGAMAIARYNNTGYIVVAGTDYYIYAYSPDGTRLWKSDVTHHTNSGHYGAVVGIADFNGDGIPEVYVGNTIFSLADGKKICSGGTTNNFGVLFGSGCSSMAADIDGDGKLELCAGNQIYRVDIAAKTMTIMTELTQTLPANAYKDGATQVADIDNDGKLEIIVVSKTSYDSNPNVVYVWKPMSGNSSYIMGSYATANSSWYSVPMIGNIDTDPYLEIVFIGTSSLMYALNFNPAKVVGSQIELKWTLSHNDGSACTGMSLFDFNQDGMNEIVYRDQEKLRIINGNYNGANTLPAANILTTFTNVASGTLRELAVVADIDNDGQADIIVQGHTSSQSYSGYVRVFKTNGSPWAPARKVWNQYAYNSVNVNDDLTIPRVQLNLTTVFPGSDGQLGTADDVRPYNNFMQQQTTLSKNGTPYMEASDYAIEGIPNAVYYPVADSLSITFCVKNYGDIQGTAPFHVAIYKNERKAGNKILTKSFSYIPASGQTACNYSLKVENVLATGGLNSLHLWLNDKGDGTSINPECDYTNGVVIYDVTGDVSAENDYASIFACDAVSIPILKNDAYSGTTFTILNTPKYGTVVQSGGVLKYTNNASGTSGLPCEQSGNRTDTIHYKIESLVSPAEAYAVVKIYNPPDIILENACSTNPKFVLSNSYDGFSYDWEYSLDGASGWTLVADDSGTELNNLKAGFYRVTINYENNKKYQLKTGVQVVEIRKTTLTGGIVWYNLSSNPVNINWQ